MSKQMFTFVAAMMTVIAFAAIPMHALAIQASPEGTPSPGASPTPATGIAVILPTEEQVPNGLVIIEDGERTLSDVTDGFTDPDETSDMFEEWGWERNVIRAFHTPDDATAHPEEIDGIYISVHEFGSPDAAAEALDYSVDVHLGDTALAERDHEELGETSRVLFGEQPYGDEITIYVQQGNALIRLSASSPEGDPTEEAIALMEWMIEQAERDQ